MVGESIQDFLFAGASINTGSPTGSVYIGVLADEFDVLDEDNETDNTAVDSYVVAASGIRLTATIEALPTEGTVFGITSASNGVAVEITTVPTTLVNTMVSYTPDPLPIGVDEVSDVFEYTLFDTSTGLTSGLASVDLIITEVFDSCLENGREVGCSPRF